MPQRHDARSCLVPAARHVLPPAQHGTRTAPSLSAFVPATEVRRESRTASGDLADPHTRWRTPARRYRSAPTDGTDHRDLLPRPAGVLGVGPRHPAWRRRAPAPPARAKVAWPQATPSCSPPTCSAGRGKNRAGGPARIRVPAQGAPPGCSSPRVNLRNSQTSDPVQSAQRHLLRTERPRPGAAMQEWRPRTTGSRRAAVTTRSLSRRGCSGSRCAYRSHGGPSTQRTALTVSTGRRLARRAPGLRRARAGKPPTRGAGQPPASTATGHPPCKSGTAAPLEARRWCCTCTAAT